MHALTTYRRQTTTHVSTRLYQARREGGVEGLATPGPTTFGGLAVGQKYKVRQNVPFWKKIENFLTRGALWKCLGARENVSPGPAVALDGPGLYGRTKSGTWQVGNRSHCTACSFSTSSVLFAGRFNLLSWADRWADLFSVGKLLIQKSLICSALSFVNN